MFLIIPFAHSGEIIVKETNWMDRTSDWFLNLFGVEPKLFYDIDNHNVKGDKQEYTLKTSIDEKDFDYEVKVLSKSANIETWLEYYDERTCERDIVVGYTEDGKLLGNGSYENYIPIKEIEEFDCSSWIRATKEEVRNKLNSDNDFAKVRVMREWGEIPQENCIYQEGQTIPYCEQRVDVIISFGGRKYIEYAQWISTSGSWNGIHTDTEESGGKIVLETSDVTDRHFKMNDDAANNIIVDSSSNNRPLYRFSDETPENSNLRTTTGQINEAQIFDGNGANRNMASSDLTGIGGTTGSIAFWMNIPSNATTTDYSHYIFSTANNNTDTKVSLRIYASFVSDRDRIEFHVFTDGTAKLACHTPVGSFIGGWHHFVLSQDGSSPIMYLDSDSKSVTCDITTDLTMWFDDVLLGGNKADTLFLANYVEKGGVVGTNDLEGSLDDVRIYGFELSQAQIDILYNSGTGTESGISGVTDGYFTSVGFGTGEEYDWNVLEQSGFSNVEVSNSSDNSSWSDWVNVTHLSDIGINNQAYLKWRGHLRDSAEGIYVNITYKESNDPADDATNLKINATTVNAYVDDDIYAEFRVGSEPDGDAVVYNITWYNNGISNLTFGNLTNSTDLTLETLESENTTTKDEWGFSIITCDIPTYKCSNEVFSSNLSIGSRPPTIPRIDLPLNNSKIGNSSIMLNCSNSTDPDGDTIYYEFYVDTNNPPTTQINITEYGQHNYTTEGNFWFRCRANDSTAYSSYTDPIYFQMDSQIIKNATLSYSDVVYETQSYNYNITVTINKWNTIDIEANLTYNNTVYTPTKTLILNNSDIAVFRFDKTIQTRLEGTTTASGRWNFNLSMVDETIENNNTYTFTNNVSRIELARCNAAFTTPFINFTFKDEDTSNYVNASIKSSTFIYSLDPTKTLTRTLSFTNNTDQDSYAFCLDPINQTLYTDIDISYDSLGYPQRSYSDSPTLTSTVLNQILWLVSSSDGIYVTFQVINVAEQPIDGVSINITRIIGGTSYSIESGETGADGGFTTWLNPDLTYTTIFSKDGYDTYTTSQKFTQSAYTITLGGVVGSVVENVTSYVQGITYSVEPTLDVLYNETDYNFNFTTISTYWGLTKSGFTLTNSTDDILGSASCTTGTGCTSSITVNTINYTSITMNYYWVVDDVYSNGTRNWFVYTPKDDRKGAFQNLISDMDKLGSGFNEFTKAIFAFFIILFVIGTLCHYSGVYSPMAILVETFFLVGFLDMIGFIPVIGVEHFITVLIGLITVGYFIFEYTR